MIRSGEWFASQSINAIQHGMASRDAVDTIASRHANTALLIAQVRHLTSRTRAILEVLVRRARLPAS